MKTKFEIIILKDWVLIKIWLKRIEIQVSKMNVDYVAKRSDKQEIEYNNYSNKIDFINFKLVQVIIFVSYFLNRKNQSRNEARI